MDEWMTTAQAAKMLGVTPRRVRQLARKEGRLRCELLTARMMVVYREDVERLVERRKAKE